MKYWRHHQQITAKEVNILFRAFSGPAELTDTYSQAMYLADTEEAMAVRHSLENYNDFTWGIIDYDKYELDNLEGLS